VRTETFATPGSLRLKVSIPSGDIRLETSDEPETHVELEARDEEALAAATIEVRERGGGHEVVVEAPKKFRLLGFGNGEYRLYVRAPHGADVNMSTSSADIEAQGQYGTVEVNSASGDARFEEVAGEARINTASGDLRISRVAGDATSFRGPGGRQHRVGGDLLAVGIRRHPGRGRVRRHAVDRREVDERRHHLGSRARR
jgi:hypothetical protein